MGKKTVQTSVKKTYSNAEVLELSSKTLTILERDAQNGNSYAITVLKEIFDNSKASEPSKKTQSARFLAQNYPQQHSKQVLKIGKVKSTSFTSY